MQNKPLQPRKQQHRVKVTQLPPPSPPTRYKHICTFNQTANNDSCQMFVSSEARWVAQRHGMFGSGPQKEKEKTNSVCSQQVSRTIGCTALPDTGWNLAVLKTRHQTNGPDLSTCHSHQFHNTQLGPSTIPPIKVVKLEPCPNQRLWSQIYVVYQHC